MKLFARPKYFSEAIAPVTTFNCILGLRAFEYPRGHPRPILSLIYLSFVYIIYCSGEFLMGTKYYSNLNLMKLEYVLYRIMMYVIIVSVLLKMILGWWHTKKFKACHKRIFEIDATLRQLGLTMNYTGLYFMTIGTIIVWITVVFIMCTVVFIHLQINTDALTAIYLGLIYTFSMSVNSINFFEFYIFARCLKTKFGLINQLLRESLTDSSVEEMKLGIFEMKDFTEIMVADHRKQVAATKIFRRRLQNKNQLGNALQNKSPPSHNSAMTTCQKRTYLLQIIKQVHLELCKISKIVCAVLGVQTAWEIGLIIAFLTGSLYNLYIRYVMNQHHVVGVIEDTFLTMSMCFIQIIKAIFLNRICKHTTDEGNRTIEIIHEIYGCDADIDMQEEIQQFGIQILQSPVTFSAFGLTLNNRIFSMILKTVTTYLVIMIQVSNTLESNKSIKYSHLEGS
ncbi:PREDICTED: uncharacterized protein LOC105558765 [Vollenhovia emeryi]|uniref:uncharacterized protein LOC105558765 n=1 Tax=Vollenhovia emeryi TaxID=411798 RepID=UPI0005F3F6CB|nr:PREDICTED: uncharacterized protein LOC105558765 [Vollenhovia emeryi]